MNISGNIIEVMKSFEQAANDVWITRHIELHHSYLETFNAVGFNRTSLLAGHATAQEEPDSPILTLRLLSY